jgi:hypothetical protein
MKNKSFVLFFILLVQSCTVTLVQPYDEKLVEATESFYKDTSLAIEDARERSPINRDNIDPNKPEENTGHFSKYTTFYSKAKVNANALIIRAMVNSGKIDKIATDIHKEIEEVISKSLPSNCENDRATISGEITLTLQNYLDLKCLVTHWEVQHKGAPYEVFRKSNWESRQLSLMRMIVNIQKAESFKTEATVN